MHRQKGAAGIFGDKNKVNYGSLPKICSVCTDDRLCRVGGKPRTAQTAAVELRQTQTAASSIYITIDTALKDNAVSTSNVVPPDDTKPPASAARDI